jgi:hypothetical protein
MAGVGLTPCRSVVAEDIRDLQRWTGHGAVTPAAGPSRSSRVSAHAGLRLMELETAKILRHGRVRRTAEEGCRPRKAVNVRTCRI